MKFSPSDGNSFEWLRMVIPKLQFPCERQKSEKERDFYAYPA